MTAIESNAPVSTSGLPAPPGDAEQRIALVNADRLCTTCGYNLIGQMVLRESHYKLLIVRCPECGTIASVQEYPLLGRWANRWGIMLAVLWFIFLLGMWPGSAGMIMGWSVGAGEEAASNYAKYIDNIEQTYTAAQAQQQAQAQPQQQGQSPPLAALGGGQTITTTTRMAPGNIQRIIQTLGGSGNDFQQWWAGQDHDAILAQAGGWKGAVDWEALVFLIPAWIFALLVGWFWSIALLQFRRRWTYVWGVFIVLLACIFAIGPYMGWAMDEPYHAWAAARQQISQKFMIGILICSIPPMFVGLAIGRPVTRLLVRGLLPPRLRNSLSLLWTAEGLALPGAKPRLS